MPAMLAAKKVRAQRDRLLQLRRRLQQQQQQRQGSPGEIQQLAADLFKLYSLGLREVGGHLSSCLELAYENDADLNFTNPAFAFVPDEQLYHTLFAQRLPPRPTTQTDAFTRIEIAYYAVNLQAAHHIPRCIEFLVGVRPPTDAGKQSDDCMVGYSDDTVAAATDHIYKTRFSGMAPPYGDSDTTERTPRTRPRRPNLDLEDRTEAPAAQLDLTWEPPRVASSKDPDQALSYLHRACSLASLAVKHIDLAVALISTFLDPKEVAEITEMANEDSEVRTVLSHTANWLCCHQICSSMHLFCSSFILITSLQDEDEPNP
jgi:hypothetical protein